jgi:hypothetical protein
MYDTESVWHPFHLDDNMNNFMVFNVFIILFIQAISWACTMQLATDLQNPCKCHILFLSFLFSVFTVVCVISYTGRMFFCALGKTVIDFTSVCDVMVVFNIAYSRERGFM